MMREHVTLDDFRGRGDSAGDTIDITPAGDLNDAQVARITFL
jgi:hypothetical protein